MTTWLVQPLATDGLPAARRPKERVWAVFDEHCVLRAVTYDHAGCGISGKRAAATFVRSQGHEVRFHVGERVDIQAVPS